MTMPFKKFLIPSRIGENLNAVHFISNSRYSENKSEKNGLIILCHGFPGDKYEWNRFLKTSIELNRVGLDSLIFDFSGYGENPREPILFSKQIHDLEDVYNWAVVNNYENISLIGLSLGGLTCLYANLTDVRTYIFWAPAFLIQKILSKALLRIIRVLKILKIKQLKVRSSGVGKRLIVNMNFIKELLSLNPIQKLREIKRPTLIIQGTADKTVKPKFSRIAFEYISDDIDHKLIEIAGATHDFSKEYLKRFFDFSIDWLRQYSK